MGVTDQTVTHQPQQGATSAGTSHNTAPYPTKATDDDKIYEVEEDDESYQVDEAVEFDAPWLTAALDKLDDKWEERWTNLKEHLKRDATTSRNELREIRDAQTKGTAATESLARLTSTSFDSIEANQRTITKTQDDQRQALQAAQKAVISDIEQKLLSTLQHLNNEPTRAAGPDTRNPNTYAHKASQPSRHDNDHNNLIPKYIEMAKRAIQTRPPTTQKNGALTILYVKDWRRKPVGVVKKALRNDIAEWVPSK